MKALVVLKDLINGKKESFANNMTVDEAEAFVTEAIKEIKNMEAKLKQGQENYRKLWDMYSELKKQKENK